MAGLVREGEVAFFRYRNRLRSGVCVSVERGKARFATSAKETVNVPVANVLLATGAIVEDRRGAAAWWSQAEVEGAEIDLQEVWDLVRDEGEAWQAEDLAGFYFGDEVTPVQMAALLVYLEESLYFEANGKGYRPLSEAEVAQRREAEDREKARAEERALFQEWFREGEEGAAPADLDSWLERLKDYTLYGDRSASAGWVGRMLEAQVNPQQVFDRLVAIGVWGADEHLDLIREGVPTEFPEVAIGASEALAIESLVEDARRRDLTGVSVVTIDDADTTDMDDGVSLLFREDGTCQVGVHITDVAALIPAGSDLDREAAGRGASLYFPDRKIPMFPKQISEVLGSLCPGVPRLALSLLFDVSPDGPAGDVEIVPSVIRCREKLTYDRVNAILDDPSEHLHSAMLALHRVAEAHLIERLEEGAVALEHSERRIRVTPEGEIQVSMRPRQSRADLLVSELMVMANGACARFCRDREIPIVYRVQQAPDLSDFEETENEVVYRNRMLRRMRPAQMTLEPGTHSGLGVAPYCQASSPLRRYADLVVQRQLSAALLDAPLPYDAEAIREVSFRAEERMRQAVRLERRREQYWLFRYMEGLVGETFDAVVLEERGRGFRAEVPDYGLQADVRPCRPVEPGETVRVRLGRCNAREDAISFVQVE